MRLSVHPVQDNSKGNTDFTNWAGASGNVGGFLSFSLEPLNFIHL